MPSFYPLRALIFDLDGTLVDSAEDLRAALNQLLGGIGLRPIEANEIKGMVGDGVLKLVQRALAAARGDPQQTDALLPPISGNLPGQFRESDPLLSGRAGNPRSAAMATVFVWPS